MDDKPKNLRTLLADAKDTSELMVDLAYAAVYFDDPAMAEEVRDLETDLTDLVNDMRSLAVLAVRHPREAPAMAAVLQVVSAIERIGNDAVNIARTVSHRLGIPRHLVVELADAEEVSHRVVVAAESAMAHKSLAELELPVHSGMRVMAIRDRDRWNREVDGETIVVPGDVLFLEGPPGGIPSLREAAGMPDWEAPTDGGAAPIPELDRAIDLLIEMKNLSEAAVALAYSALVLGDRSLAAEVRHLEALLDDMHDQLESWVLRAASNNDDPSPLRGLLHLAAASEDIGDQASQMVMLVESGDEIHPVLGIALADADEVVLRVPVASGCQGDGASLAELQLDVAPGYNVLALKRGTIYKLRPAGTVRFAAGDEIIASGPDEGRERFAEIFGWRLEADEETGENELAAL
ncbi:MAG: potassium channel protein [Acidimicrobiales bacterium]|nr:potassium channel protein [Acidimicrobiales bacterium]RZV47792.1 MAG: potassium channel protein [Acidimicrobiales bacterium]